MALFGRTWWGQRFIAALEEFTDGGRLSRGRSYANSGRIIEHTVVSGAVNARVRGSINPYFGIYKEPIYSTTLNITHYSVDQWTVLVERIGKRADLVTRLLQQEMPDRIEEVFGDVDLDLLPESEDDFQTTCSCPDFFNPCKHIAGVCYTLATDLDRDPFLLFALRGLSRERLAAELLKSPLGKILAEALSVEKPAIQPLETFHTRPIREQPGTAIGHREFWIGSRRLTPLDAPSQARVPALLIKKQGDYPPFWHGNASFIGVMEELYERVRTKSRQMK